MAKAKVEKKEVVKKSTKVSKKSETKKPKEIEIIDEIIDDVEEVEETVEVEDIKPKKTYRELRSEFRNKKNDIEVEIVNLNSCTTVSRDRNGRVLFRLNNTGDREFITLADLFDVANLNKDVFRKHMIAIIDVDSEDGYTIEDVLTYLNLEEIYQDNGIENYDTDYIGQILKLDTRKFERFIEDANEELVRMVAGRAVDLYKKKKFDSRIKEMALAKRLNREDLFED